MSLSLTKTEFLENVYASFRSNPKKGSVVIASPNDEDSLILKYTGAGNPIEVLEDMVKTLGSLTISGINSVDYSDGSFLSGNIVLARSTIPKNLTIVDSVIIQSEFRTGETFQSIVKNSRIENCLLDIRYELIEYSELFNLEITNSNFSHTKFNVISPEINTRLKINESNFFGNEITMEPPANPPQISGKTIQGLCLRDAIDFNGDYLSIDLGPTKWIALIESGTKYVLANKGKKFNLGVWVDTFINKEKNQFVKTINQNILQLLECYFDSLTFKK